MSALTLGDRFQIADPEIDLLGHGGMGDVYRGVDLHTGRLVAVKALKPEVVVSHPHLLDRFVREGEALRQLDHPNIVKMLAAVEQDGRHYLVMEYIGGGSLHDLLEREGQMPVGRVLDVALDLADALTRAHRLGIIHRDLKPANILLDEAGVPHLSDFGVARLPATPHEGSEPGVLVGTVHYVSPEACHGQPLDARADIWSFGVVLYEMLTAERPFVGDSLMAVLTAILTQPVPDLAQHRPDLPDALADLIYRMLEKDREQRIPSVRLVGAELEAIATGRAAVPITPDTPPPARPAGQRHNLPVQPIPFVGRQTELAELNRLLADPSVRLITVAGAGGMGKTRLALEAAALHLDRFADGVYLVPLAPVPSPDGMVAAVAEATGLDFGQADPCRQLLDYLRAKSLLLILDNFEHVADGAPLVADILAEAPGVKIVATSRARLDLQGEHLFYLAGMELPESAAAPGVRNNAAIRLFIQGARRIRPGYEPDAADLEQIVRICRLVEGMPLGILLAAAWLEMLSPAEIAAEVARSYDFLETNLRDLPERQRSMRAVFEYSWNLLNEREREIFSGLSVYCCNFTRDAAQQITGATLRELMALTTKSLLYRTLDGRYEGHGMLQQYAAAKLDGLRDGGRSVRDRHAAYYLGLLSGWEDDLHGPRQQEALAAIDTESDNIRTAWIWAVEQGQVERFGPVMDSLGNYCSWRGRYTDGEAAFRLAAERLAELGEAAPVRLMPKALAWQSVFYRALGQPELDRQRGQQALTLLEGIEASGQGEDLRSEKAFAHMQVGVALARSGDHRGARRHYGQSLVLYRVVGDAEGTAESLFGLGWVAARLSQFDEARRLCEESLAICRASGDLRGIASALGLLGNLALDQGQSEDAVRFMEESVAIRRRIGDRPEIAASLTDWGRMLNYTGEFAASYDQYHEALAIYQDLGTRAQVAAVYSYLANSQSHQGNYDQARSLGQTALALARQVGEPGIMAYTLYAVGGAMLATGDPAEARRLLEEGLTLYRTTGQKASLASCMGMLGGARYRLGDLAEARPLLRDALRLAVEVKAFVPKLVTLALAARLLAEQGQIEEAAELWSLLSGYPFVAQSHWFADVAGREIVAAAETLPPDVAAAAQLLGRTRDLDSAAAEVADELDRQVATAAATWTPPPHRPLRGQA